MKYFRNEMDAGSFADFMPEGSKIYIRPELPKIEFKHGKLKCTMSDLRLLHPLGVAAFEKVLETMATVPEKGKATLLASKDVDEDTLMIVADIVTGFSYEAKRGGKNGWMNAGSLVYSYSQHEVNNGGTEMEFTFSTETAGYVRDYAEAHGNTIHMAEMIAYIAERSHEYIGEQIEKGNVLM